jgi:hypothetical protein
MDATVRTPVHKRKELHFLVDGLQVWVTYLDKNENNGPFGVRFKWMEHQHSTSPHNHITEDGGFTYLKFDSFIMPAEGTVDMRANALETDPEKLSRLQKIWVEYQKQLGEEVFSV